MKADQAIAAFRGFLEGNHDHAVSVLRQIEASEAQAGRTAVAEKLRRLLQRNPQMIRLPNAPKHVQMYEPSVMMESVVLSQAALVVMSQLVDEWQCREELQSHDLAPRSTVLLHGPSGNGKTHLAKALAHSLSLPLLLVDYGSMVSSYRGTTGGNISEVMKFAQVTRCVVFFDEADSLLCSRNGRVGSTADREDVRSVNQVLVSLDALESRSLVVFASNRIDVLDSALLRRMAISLEMPAPQNGQREAFVRRIATRWPFLDCEALCREAKSAASFAECEDLVRDAARSAIVQKSERTPVELRERR